MTTRISRFRSAFTLLEVVLATTIAVLLLGGLYVAVDMQLRYAQAARDIVEDSTLARATLTRIDADVSLTVGLSDPARFRLASAASSSTNSSSASGTTPAASTGTTATGGSTTTTGSNSSSSSSSNSTASTPGSNPITLPLGVQGDSEQVNLIISRLPREVWSMPGGDGAPVVSDLRRVSYWLAGGADNPAGLARQEIPLITSADALNNQAPDVENEASFVIADEVRSLQFQYFDGTDWQDSWDSTTLGSDGITPIGSPQLIAVTIGVPRSRSNPQDLKLYRHVIAIPSANGVTQQTQSTTTGAGTSP